MKFFAGIDIGTSSAKFLVIDEHGKIHGQKSIAYDYSSPQSGWTEIEPAIWIKSVEEGMESLLGDLPADCRENISAIGVTGQMHTTVFLDEQGKSLRPALMWNDTRTLSLLSDVKERIEGNKQIPYLAKIISTGSPAINLYWLKTAEPENFSRLRKFLIGPDYVVYRLTGFMGTDYCEASTSSLYDFECATWSKDMKKILGLPDEIFPPINGAGIVVGTLSSEFAQKWQLSSKVKVIAGTGDNPAAAFANGVGSDSDSILSLGTSGVLVVARSQADFNRRGKNIAFSADGKQISYLGQGVVQATGRAMNWWMKNILREKDLDGDLRTFDTEKLGENDLIFYPHIMGEKTIYGDMSLRGAFLGLSDETTRADMQIAVMEGITFGVKELVEAMGIARENLNPVRVTGGGARSKIWLQIIADVLEMPVIQLSNNASAVYGVALLAGGKEIQREDSEDTRKIIFRPRLKNAVLYRKKYRRYKKIHDSMKEIFSD